MKLSRFDRKRTDRFVEFIDTASGPRTHRRTSVDDELAPLTQLARQLRELPLAADAPTEDFRGALRSFLVATAERDGIGATASPQTRTAAATKQDTAAWQAIKPATALGGRTQSVRQVSTRGPGRTRLAVLIGVAAGAIILSGVSAASTGALPGDPLYSVKRSTERAQLALAGSDTSRGKLYLEFARNRVAEAGRVDAEQARTALADMDNETRQGVALLLGAAVASNDAGGLATVTAFVQRQRTALTQLADKLPAGLEANSLALLTRISTRIAQVSQAIARSCAFPTADELGPIPDDC